MASEGVNALNRRDAVSVFRGIGGLVVLRKQADGTATVQFGGEGKVPNSLPIMTGWNYMVHPKLGSERPSHE